MVYCNKCECRIHHGLDGIKEHIKEERHVAPFVCKEGDCWNVELRFEVKSSWIRHLLLHHHNACFPTTESSSDSDSSQSSSAVSAEESDTEVDSIDSGTNAIEDAFNYNNDDTETSSENSDDAEDDFGARLEKAAALLLLRLKRHGNVPGVAVSLVIQESAKLMRDVFAATLDKISSNLREHSVDGNVIDTCVRSIQFKDPFANIQSSEQQLIYFQEHFGLIRPSPKPLESRWDERRDRKSGLTIPVQVKVNFEYISLTKILTAVLNHPVYHKLIHSEKKSTDGHLRSYLDGSAAKSNALLVRYPFTIRINKWMDDSEVVNPLGSKTSVHKIVTDAFTLQNLPPEENARLRSIFVNSYAYREDLPADRGVDMLLEPFFYEMEQLETEEGIPITVNGNPYTLRATLTTGSADTLAGHELVGLGSPSCNRFCSVCLITKNEFRLNIFAMGLKRSKQVHQENIRELNTRGAAFALRSSGVVRESRLVTQPQFAEFPGAMVKDPMHDILRGIAPMEIKLALHQFCMVNKYLEVEEFNAILQSFNYGPPDLKNKPSPNFTKDSLTKPFSYVLHQTAAQTWCLLRIFPFLVACKVPDDCPHLNLLVLLKRISDIVFSTDLSQSDLNQLLYLIQEHHTLFITLYPLPPPSYLQIECQEEEEDDEDFLEEEEGQEEDGEQVDDPQPDSHEPTTQTAAKKNKKQHMVIRPLNKHHHILHYVELIKMYGPIVLYWCMRFEAKNALIKRYGAICNNFKYLPGSFANLHQIVQAADFLDLVCPVKEERSTTRGKLKVAGSVPDFATLSFLGVKEDDVLREVREATVGGFRFIVGLHVALPLVVNDLPLFGKIIHIYASEKEVLIVTKDLRTCQYSLKFGAYLIEETPGHQEIRAFVPSNLPPIRPMTMWTADQMSFYLSPRNAIADMVVGLGRTIEN